MNVFSPSHFPFPLPEKHRFPVVKYAQLRTRLVDEGWTVSNAQPISWSACLNVHCVQYVDALQQGQLTKQQIRGLGFPWSPELMVRSLASVGGTVQAASAALEHGWAANLAGGTHHAFAERGEGFCVLNDVVVAADSLHKQGEIGSAIVVDLDVHQGNGTAVMAKNLRWLHTISVHGAKNYPFRKEVSDLDVPLADGINGQQYMEQLNQQVLPFMDSLTPDLVFLNAGADVLSGDRYGRLELSPKEVGQRDAFIAAYCHSRGIPLVWVMGGGYHPEIGNTVEAHFQSLVHVKKVFGRL